VEHYKGERYGQRDIVPDRTGHAREEQCGRRGAAEQDHAGVQQGGGKGQFHVECHECPVSWICSVYHGIRYHFHEQLQQNGDILTVGTLESYQKIKEYYKEKEDTKLLPVYITVDEEERKKRAIQREEKQKSPNYHEVERRIKADNIDFSEENLKQAGIEKEQTFENYDLNTCVEKIINYIQ